MVVIGNRMEEYTYLYIFIKELSKSFDALDLEDVLVTTLTE